MTSELYYKYWGKARRREDGGYDYHLLPHHSLDVAAVGISWIKTNPTVRERLAVALSVDRDDRHLCDWLGFVLSLHDLGKFDLRFQTKVPEVRARIWSDLAQEDTALSEANVRGFDHGAAGYGRFVRQLAGDIFPKESIEDSLDEWRPWIAAVTGHHGVVPQQAVWAQPATEPNVQAHDRDASCQWVLAVAKLFLGAGLSEYHVQPLPDHCQPLIAGFCSVADWIASNEQFVRWVGTAQPLDEYLAEATEHCRNTHILSTTGLSGRTVTGYTGVKTLLSRDMRPRQAQAVIDDLPAEPGLIIVEGTTGSGKTEAALAMAWRIIEAEGADSIVFALPTQATADAMLDRIEKLAPIIYGSSDPNLVLAHGKAKYNELFANLKAGSRAHAAQEGDQAAVQCAEWISASRKRVFLGQIGICTIDQVLLSVLPVRHSFVRSFGVAKSVLIVDEVHAYDRYMYGLLTEVLKRQKAVGGSAILLSATLPAVQKRDLFEAWHRGSGAAVAVDAPYPLLSKLTVAGAPSFTPMRGQEAIFRRVVGVELVESGSMEADASILGKLLTAASAGGTVAVVCNLVQSAQTTARKLRALAAGSNLTVDIFHARYRYKDRQAREAIAKSAYGRNAPRDRGRILVATQVIEQSLDLDFDWMISQLCPVDLLFQRWGRLHRHERARPEGFEVPRCTILTTTKDDFGAHQMIYGDVRILWRTRELLRGSNGEVAFPDAYRAWIEKVYGSDEWAESVEPDAVIGQSCAFRQQERQAQNKAIMLATAGINPFDDTDQNASSLTRGKEMGLNVVPVLAGKSTKALLGGEVLTEMNEFKRGEALNMEVIPVPSSWKEWLPRFDDGYIYLPMAPEGDGWVWKNGKWSLRYSLEFGLERTEDGA